MSNISKHHKFVITSMFTTIIFILAFTPFGYIHLGIIKATIVHIPVILGSILLGFKVGALLGFSFGLTSFISNTINPTLLSFAFSPLIPMPGTDRGSLISLIICFIPRILVGIFPYFVYRFFQRFYRSNVIPLFISGILGSMSNTILVMNLIYFLFQNAYSTTNNVPANAAYSAVIIIMATNGIPEALIAGIIVSMLGNALIKINYT